MVVSEEIRESVLPLYSNVYDDITDFEICEIQKNKKI